MTLYFLTLEVSGSATMTFPPRQTGASNWELKRSLLPYFPPDILPQNKANYPISLYQTMGLLVAVGRYSEIMLMNLYRLVRAQW